jgi:hypothetical protein
MLTYVSDAAAGRRELAAARLLDLGLLDFGLPDFGEALFAGQLAPGQQAGAKPPRFSGLRAKESLGLYALRVSVVAERVRARWREKTIVTASGIIAASDPGGVADRETCFATTVAAAGFSLQLGKPPQC